MERKDRLARAYGRSRKRHCGEAGKCQYGRSRKRRKRQINWNHVLVGLLLFVGSVLLLYPVFNDWYYQRRFARMINQYGGDEKSDSGELLRQAEDYNRQLLENEEQFWLSEGESEKVKTLLDSWGTEFLGTLDIPKISVHIPIYPGTDDDVLQKGAGFWIGTSFPVGGESTHSVLAAHNGLVSARLFTDLDKLGIGDVFSITVLDRKLTYEVDQILVTEPSEFAPLRIVEGQDYVTLYTCTPYGLNIQRLLVRGRRMENLTEEGGKRVWPVWKWSAVLAVTAAFGTLPDKRRRRESRRRKYIKKGREKDE